MTYYKTVFRVDGSSLGNISNGLKKAGFKVASVKNRFPSEELYGIIQNLNQRESNAVLSGISKIVPRKRVVFSNNEDVIAVDDFDIAQNNVFKSDPVIFCYERVSGRTSTVVKEILEDTIKVDLIKNALRSINSRQFRTSVLDLARISNENPNKVYERCVRTLIKSSVSGIKSIDVNEQEIFDVHFRERIPIEAV